MARAKTVVTDSEGNVVESKEASRQIGVKIDADLYAWLEEHRWSRRLSMSGLGAAVLAEYAAQQGYAPAE